MRQAISSRHRVVYLFGAGASHACVKAVGSAHGILMRDLSEELAERVRIIVEDEFKGNESLRILVNDVIDEHSDFEHIITFLDESSSGLHRNFAEFLRKAFEDVLRKRLREIESEQGRTPDDLYAILLDMYSIADFPETLRGFLTLNYDCYLESAIERSATYRCDRGISFDQAKVSAPAIRTLKLHGSFDWNETWPVSLGHGPDTMWIPPGIQKDKEHYPFNVLWGLAHEMLDCDILRVIGCRLGSNDWDLISLLFATRHTNTNGRPYRIEVIDAPRQVGQLQNEYPYLDVHSMLEVEPIGSQLVAEVTGGEPSPYQSLTAEERETIITKMGADKNWFRMWLKYKAEATLLDLGSVRTPSGAFENFLEAY